MTLLADMRYHGQAFELVVPWGNVQPDAAALAHAGRRISTRCTASASPTPTRPTRWRS